MKKLAILFIVSAMLASIAGFVYAAQSGGQTINTFSTVYVKKAGDVMTGSLGLPTLNCSGRITGESLTITNTATAGAYHATNIQLGTAVSDAGMIKFIMGAQAGDPTMTISPEVAGGITFTTDQSLQPFTFWNTASGASGILVIKGADVTAGNGQLKCNDETDGNSTDIYNSSGNGYIRTNGSAPGELNLQADIKGNVRCFGLTDTGDTTDGKHLIVTRMAAEGDNQIDLYVDNARQPIITADAGSIATVALLPMASDGYALGSGTVMWSDLFLASGGVVNFNNGNATITHSSGLLTFNTKLAGTQMELTGTATAAVLSAASITATAAAISDLTVTNVVTATAFAGDGSHLTGIQHGTLLYYLRSYASDISTYFAASAGYDTASAEAPIAKASIAVGDSIKFFATPSGFPGLSLLPDEPWQVHFHAQRTTGNKAVVIKAELYKRSGSANILINTSEATPAITSSSLAYDIHGFIPVGTTIEATDRLVVNLFAFSVGAGSATDISVFVEGPDVSHLEIPGPVVSIANFVPYTGATAALNLGVYNLTTTGTVQALSLKATDLTATRLTYAGASGLLSDNSKLIFDGTNLAVGTTAATSMLTVYGTVEIKAGTGGGVKYPDGTIQITAAIAGGLGGNNTWTNPNTFESTLTAKDKVILTPLATTFLVTADALTVSAAVMQVSGNGQAITLTSTPNIVAGVAGQIVTLIGTSDANTLTIQDEAQLGSSGLVLAGDQNFTIGLNDTIMLIYNGSKYVELARSSN